MGSVHPVSISCILVTYKHWRDGLTEIDGWKGIKMQRLILSVLALAMALPAYAQTREKRPWWPSQWGADDQMGASNRITAETILKAAQLVKTGKMYELGQVYDRDMPILPGRTYAMFIPGSPTGRPLRQQQYAAVP